jgi:hypothetical protein
MPVPTTATRTARIVKATMSAFFSLGRIDRRYFRQRVRRVLRAEDFGVQ